MYKIMNKAGMFSSGGARPEFRKHGHTWNGIGPLKLHLNQLDDFDVYKECVLVKCKYEVSTEVDLPQFVEDWEKELEAKKQAEELRDIADDKRIRKEKYLELKKEFG